MVGRQLEEFPGIAEQIAALGHQVGVHTYDHVGLDDYLGKNGGDVVRQISMTINLLPNQTGSQLYLRAPYGQWSSSVAQTLNDDLLTCITCFGPIHWDNTATDWDKWLDGVAPQDVAKQYLDNINTMGKGIVLMHDNMANVRRFAPNNRGFSLAQNLVPALLQAGYDLRRVDTIPSIANTAATTPRIALRGTNGAFVSPQDGGGREILLSGVAPSWWEKLTLLPLGSNRVAMQAPGGQYFTLHDDGITVTATAAEVGDWETFEAISCGAGTCMFRTYTGDFLSIGPNVALVGNAGQTDPNNRFSFFVYQATLALGAT
jgi:hypothetical protein